LTIKDIHRAISKIIRPGTTRRSSSEDGTSTFSGEPTIVATGRIERLGDIKDLFSRYGIGSSPSRPNRFW
jgi:hypothetical protein